MTSVPSDHHIPRAVFKVKKVECIPCRCLTRIHLERPDEPTYPLRVGQLAMLNDFSIGYPIQSRAKRAMAMSEVKGYRCSICGIKHNAPALHRCKYVNPEGVKRAEQNRQRQREMYARLRQQKYKCARCRYELAEKGNTLEQLTEIGVVCKACAREA